LGALFGKLMEDSGSVQSVANSVGAKLGAQRAILAVVLAGAAVTYGGVSLFVAFFVLAPMAAALFKDVGIPRRLMPGAIALGSISFTMSALPGTPAIQNAIPMPYFQTTPFAAPGIGLIAAAIMLFYGLWWLGLVEARARKAGEGFENGVPVNGAAEDLEVRERATVSQTFDPPEVHKSEESKDLPPFWSAFAPLAVVVAVNLLMTVLILPSMDLGYLAEKRFGPTTPSAVTGIWSVVVAVAASIVALLILNGKRLPNLKASMDAGVNASVLPLVSVASLVGFGSVVAGLPAFEAVKEWVLGIQGGPLVSLAVSTNILAALTGSASGGLTIALEALGPTYMQLAQQLNIDPGLMHRVAAIGAGTLDVLPHNGAVITLLAVCGCTHKDSYIDIAQVAIVGPMLSLIAIIAIGSAFGSF
jgi:H+/gluconate symporter-like permease